jgi:membrane protein implicated in regulation of membrane protease activity
VSWLAHLAWWHWLVAAVALAALEALFPGAVAIWFGAAAAVIGVLMLVLDIPWQLQYIGFAALGVVAMVAYRNYLKRHPFEDEQPNLNLRGHQYIGSELVLIEAIAQGSGKAKLGDGVWKVSGPDLPAGARVKVIGVNGTILTVAAV